jgi:hypothetical protein
MQMVARPPTRPCRPLLLLLFMVMIPLGLARPASAAEPEMLALRP